MDFLTMGDTPTPHTQEIDKARKAAFFKELEQGKAGGLARLGSVIRVKLGGDRANRSALNEAYNELADRLVKGYREQGNPSRFSGNAAEREASTKWYGQLLKSGVGLAVSHFLGGVGDFIGKALDKAEDIPIFGKAAAWIMDKFAQGTPESRERDRSAAGAVQHLASEVLYLNTTRSIVLEREEFESHLSAIFYQLHQMDPKDPTKTLDTSEVVPVTLTPPAVGPTTTPAPKPTLESLANAQLLSDAAEKAAAEAIDWTKAELTLPEGLKQKALEFADKVMKADDATKQQFARFAGADGKENISKEDIAAAFIALSLKQDKKEGGTAVSLSFDNTLTAEELKTASNPNANLPTLAANIAKAFGT